MSSGPWQHGFVFWLMVSIRMHIEGNIGLRDHVNIFYTRAAIEPEMHRVSPAYQLLPFVRRFRQYPFASGFELSTFGF